MNYPSEILPNDFYKFISCDLSSYFLIRYTENNNLSELIDPITGFIKQEYICHPSANMMDLSLSLLGIFQIYYTKIELSQQGKMKYTEYCLPDDKVDIPAFNQDFAMNTNRHYWTILVGLVQNQPVDYLRANNPFQAICKICHTPMKWNYWHFSIRWLTDKGFWHQLEEKEKNKLSKRLAHEARSLIAMSAKIQEPSFPILPNDLFCKVTPALKSGTLQ